MPLTYTTVIGRFLRAIDADTLVPLEGLKLTFSPTLSPPQVLDLTADPPAFITIDPVIAYTDVDGNVDTIVISGENPDFSPEGWTYKVSIVGENYPLRFFYFFAPAGATVDLVDVPHFPADLGTDIILWQRAVDEVNSGVQEVEDLIDGLDTRLIPEGGTPPQVLGKTGAGDFEVGWVNGTGAPSVEYVQSVPAAVWGPVPVPFGLGRRPNVQIFLGNEVVSAPVDVSETEVTATFPSPMTGSMVLN